MKYLKVVPEDRDAINKFRVFALEENLHIVLRKRAIFLLQAIVESRTPKSPPNAAQITALERRGFIRLQGKKWVHTELGLLALAFAVAGGVISQPGDATVTKIKSKRAA